MSRGGPYRTAHPNARAYRRNSKKIKKTRFVSARYELGTNYDGRTHTHTHRHSNRRQLDDRTSFRKRNNSPPGYQRVITYTSDAIHHRSPTGYRFSSFGRVTYKNDLLVVNFVSLVVGHDKRIRPIRFCGRVFRAGVSVTRGYV